MNVCLDAGEFELGRLGWHFPFAILILSGSESVLECRLGLSNILVIRHDVVVCAKVGRNGAWFGRLALGKHSIWR